MNTAEAWIWIVLGAALGGSILVLAVALALLALRAHPRTAAPVNRDYLAPERPLYGAARLPARPVPPVLVPADLLAQRIQDAATADGIWTDPTDPAPLRPYRVDWQARIQEGRN